ncbi:conserved protein of unknown function [Tenacibaculum sp. 190130A14a]|uniref:Uncharacterized protein n=1 Tax=Tenacibaculum polynesiense TaxID=3137857 RepID=A0ABM9P7A3_9FLAO
MNKYSNYDVNFAQNSTQNLSNIGFYNQRVREYLANNALDRITQYAVNLFKDNAQRNKLTDKQYNNAVEEFNQRNGFILLKKGSEHQTSSKYYSYINYPYLDRLAVKFTMDKYRQFVNNYNKQADNQNKEIRDYNNTQVKNHLALTKAQRKRKTSFESSYNHLFVLEYNLLVEKQNQTEAIVPKRRIQKIKFQSEIIFQVLVGFYVSQLRSRNAYLREMNKPTSVLKNSLPPPKIDHRKLATHKIEDIPRLDICKKTAQNHVKRLREAQILINYKRINQNKPIQVNFNPQILEILDGNPPKSKTPENKALPTSIEKSLHDNSEPTRAFLKEKEIKDCANSNSLKKCGSILEENVIRGACPADSYKNTKGMNKKNKPQGAVFFQKTSTPPNTYAILTKNFLERKMDERDLADKLANGDFDNYQGLKYHYLQQVAQYAHVNLEDFKKIIIQDFLKSSAKIWKNHEQVYYGNWKKTINLLYVQFFERLNNKETIINKLKEYRWKINWARQWFNKKKEVKALFPYAYFDSTRTQSNEIGFYGLHKIWKKNQEYKKKNQAKKNNLVQRSNARKRRLSAQEKLNKVIRRFYSGKINHKQLYNYVQDNLPNEYLKMLPSIIFNNTENLA